MSETHHVYLKLSTERDLLRELEGLSQEEEAVLAGVLDELWWEMSLEEQEDVERLYARIPEAPAHLGLVDRVVPLGSREHPRG